jgi:hypothetical protein
MWEPVVLLRRAAARRPAAQAAARKAAALLVGTRSEAEAAVLVLAAPMRQVGARGSAVAPGAWVARLSLPAPPAASATHRGARIRTARFGSGAMGPPSPSTATRPSSNGTRRPPPGTQRSVAEPGVGREEVARAGARGATNVPSKRMVCCRTVVPSAPSVSSETCCTRLSQRRHAQPRVRSAHRTGKSRLSRTPMRARTPCRAVGTTTSPPNLRKSFSALAPVPRCTTPRSKSSWAALRQVGDGRACRHHQRRGRRRTIRRWERRRGGRFGLGSRCGSGRAAGCCGPEGRTHGRPKRRYQWMSIAARVNPAPCA